jgi:hypothetical protein
MKDAGKIRYDKMDCACTGTENENDALVPDLESKGILH